jgi:nucleoside phosphorylase
MSSATKPACSPYPNNEYTVGWICALPIEMAAAKGMIDEEHGDPQTLPQGADHNTYLLGRIGKFKAVVACLPKDEIGSSSAAAVAKDLLFTFPNVRVGLFVGIGGLGENPRFRVSIRIGTRYRFILVRINPGLIQGKNP